MAIGRISGSMLKSNLTRNGVDLAFETNILYLDVTNARVGIGTSGPSSALQVVGTITTNTLTTVGDDSTQYGLNITGNNISTSSSNSNIVLNPSGTGAIDASSSKIINVTDPTNDQDAATKHYVDGATLGLGPGTVVSISAGDGITASPNPITSSGTISLDFNTIVARVVGDDSTGTDIRVGETVKIAGAGGITTAVSGDTLTITGANQAQGLKFVGDDSTGTQISDGETIKIAGAQNISTAVSGDTLTITGPDLSNYLTNSTITFVGDDSTGVTLNSNETVKIAGGTNITTAVVNDVVTITGSKDIDVNSISSGDSSAIQINDAVNVSGTLSADVLDVNEISSSDSSAIQINDAVNVSGVITGGSNIIASVNLISNNSSGDEGGEILLAKPQTNTTLIGTGVTIDSYRNKLRFFEQGGTARGYYVDITNGGAGVSSELATVDYVNAQIVAAGSGTVTSITAGTGLTASPNPITTTGTISLDLSTVVARVVGDDSTGTDLRVGETVKIAGGNNITTAVSGDTLTITGSKDIDVNSISSTDSTAVQIADGLNVSGTLTANTFVTNEISSSESTAIQVNDSLNASGTITATSFVTHGTSGNITGVNNIEVNQISSNDSTAVQVADSMNVSGTLTANTFVTNNISSAESTAIEVNDALNVQGTLTANVIQTNELSSTESSAIQVNDGLNVRGTLTATGLVANGITYPTTDGTANQVLVTNGAGTLSFTSLNSFAGITFVGDDSSGSTINTAETLKFVGGNNITTAVINDTVTITVSKDIDVNSISSGDSSAIQINDAVNVSGTFNAKTIVTNDLISEDSTAINVLDGLNVSGTMDMNNNIISNVQDPVANQDAATKNYVDTQISGVSTSFYVEDDTSTIATIDSGDTLRIIGSGGITTAVSGDTLTIVGSNPAQGITFFDSASTSTAIPDGGALQITSGEGISTSILGNVITITNTSTQLEIDGGSAYSVYNAISEALIDGGTA